MIGVDGVGALRWGRCSYGFVEGLRGEQHPVAVHTVVSHAEMEVWSAFYIFAQKWYHSCIKVLAPT